MDFPIRLILEFKKTNKKPFLKKKKLDKNYRL